MNYLDFYRYLAEDRDPELFNFNISYDIPRKQNNNIYFHGTHKEAYEKILKEGVLKPWDKENEKTSLGSKTEKGLIWLTQNKKIAFQYAEAWEANDWKGKRLKVGGIIEVSIPNLKLIERYEKPSPEQRKIILNYAKEHIKSSEWASAEDIFYELSYYVENQSTLEGIVSKMFNFINEGGIDLTWPIILHLLGYNGILYDQKQIGVAAKELPVIGAFRFSK